MRKLLLRILYIPQVVLLCVFIVIRYIPSISPGEYQIMGVLGLITPVLVVVNIVFLLFWIIAKKYLMAGLAALGFVISWNVLCVCFGFNFFKR